MDDPAVRELYVVRIRNHEPEAVAVETVVPAFHAVRLQRLRMFVAVVVVVADDMVRRKAAIVVEIHVLLV